MRVLIKFKNFVRFYKMNRLWGDSIFQAFYYALCNKAFFASYKDLLLDKQITTTELETFAIRELIDCYGTNTNAQALANKQLQKLLDKIEYMSNIRIMNRSVVKELYSVLVYAVVDENTSQRAAVIATTNQSEDLEYYIIAECNIEDAWLVCEALQIQADIKYQKIVDECEEIAQQITQQQ